MRAISSAFLIAVFLFTPACAIKNTDYCCIKAAASYNAGMEGEYYSLGQIELSKPYCRCFLIKNVPPGLYQLGFLVPFEEAINNKLSLPKGLVLSLSISRLGREPFLFQTVSSERLYPDTAYFPFLPNDHPVNKPLFEKQKPVFFSVGQRTGGRRIRVEKPEITYDEGNAYYYAYGYESAPLYGADFGRDLAFEPSNEYQYSIKCQVESIPPECTIACLMLVFQVRHR